MYVEQLLQSRRLICLKKPENHLNITRVSKENHPEFSLRFESNTSFLLGANKILPTCPDQALRLTVKVERGVP